MLLLTTPVAAQPGGDTFAAKSVAMIIGFGPGGGYDLWGRTVGRHIGRHLPGAPTVTPQNVFNEISTLKSELAQERVAHDETREQVTNLRELVRRFTDTPPGGNPVVGN